MRAAAACRPGLSHSSPDTCDPVRGPGRRGILAATAGLFMALAGLSQPVLAQTAAGDAGARTQYRLGLIGPFTGPSSDFGLSMKQGVELAVREINELGGYMGRKLEIVVRDDHANPADGRVATTELLDKEKVDFTIGFCNSGVALKSIDLFEARRSVLIVPCATATQITRTVPLAQGHVFRVAPTDEMSAKALVREIVERRHLQRVAVLADQTGYGDGGLRDFSNELNRHGLKPAYVGRFPLGVDRLDEQMKGAKDAGADALVVYSVGPEQAAAVRTRAAMRWDVPYFAPWTLSFRSVLEQAGPQPLEGTMMIQSIIQDAANERRASFQLRFGKATGDRKIGSLMAAAQAYDATHLLLRALFVSHGDASGDALKHALEHLEAPYRGVVSTYESPFSPTDHEAYAPGMLWLGNWRKGEIHFVHAEDARLSSVYRRKDAP